MRSIQLPTTPCTNCGAINWKSDPPKPDRDNWPYCVECGGLARRSQVRL